MVKGLTQTQLKMAADTTTEAEYLARMTVYQLQTYRPHASRWFMMGDPFRWPATYKDAEVAAAEHFRVFKAPVRIVTLTPKVTKTFT